MIFETVPGYSICGVYSVVVSRRPPEEMGVTAPGYSTSGGGIHHPSLKRVRMRIPHEDNSES